MQPLLPELNLIKLFAGEEFQQAFDRIVDCLESDSDNVELCNLAGICASRLGNMEVAESFWLRAQALDPQSSTICSNLGALHAAQGNRQKAEEFYYRAVELDNASAEMHFNLANFLAGSGSTAVMEKAKAAFLDVIRIMPTHYGAWLNLGNLLFETGYVSAAHTAYTAAATYHPQVSGAHVNLGNVALHRDEPVSAAAHFLTALGIDPELPEAHQGLASAYHRQGDGERAACHREKGFGDRPVSYLPYRGRGLPVPLLVLASSLEGNVPWRFLIDQRLFQAAIVAVECFGRDAKLPEHRLILNAIGDADLCRDGLEFAGRLVRTVNSPLINSPQAVLKTGRLDNAKRLGSLPGVITPNMALVSRRELLTKPLSFPVLLRSPGFHGGHYFVRADDRNALQRAMTDLPGDSLLMMDVLDSRSEDGFFRKFRVMAIDGVLYPVHLAISRKWKVHYFSADMTEKHRKEEEAFLNDFPACLGAGVVSALHGISDVLGLDYCGMDFAIDGEGNILLYEANATMTFVPPGSDREWDYKRPAIENALKAAKRMFFERLQDS